MPVLVFTAVNYKFEDEHLEVYLDYDLVRIYLKTDTEYKKIMDASVQAYNYELVNKGTLKDPVMVKELVLKRACPK